MAVADKTGKMHHSGGRARLADSMAGDKPKPKPMEKKPEAAADDDGNSEDIESVVKKHGPAHHVEYDKDKETGKHKVKSVHGEQNVEHESEFDSEPEAHVHVGKAMGGSPAEEDPDEEMGDEAGEIMPEMEHKSHGHIPGLG